MRFLSRLLIAVLFASLVGAGFEVSGQTKKRTRRKVKTTTTAPAQPMAPVIAKNTQIKIRLNNDIDTNTARDGDAFAATVLDPAKYAESTVEGHIAVVKKSGKFKGKTALNLTFDRITFSNGTSRALTAQLVRVYGEDSAKNVDQEGTIESGSKTKTTTVRTGGGAAAGAVIGAVVGGGKGAAIGAVIGAAAGAGSTYIQGSNKIKLDRGTEILIVTIR